MRVQRAPRAAQQPQQPPAGLDLAPGRSGSTHHPASASTSATTVVPSTSRAAAPATGGLFCASIDLDLTRLGSRLRRPALVGEVVVLLVLACRAEGLIDDESPLRLLRPAERGLVGRQLDQAVRLSAYAISSALDTLSGALPPGPSRALSVLDLSLSPVRSISDWGQGGAGVVTLGRIATTVVSHPLSDGSGLGLAHRQLAPLGFVAPDAPAHGVLRVLESVAHSIEQLSR